MTNILYNSLMILKNTNSLAVEEKYYVTDRGETYLALTNNILILEELTFSDYPSYSGSSGSGSSGTSGTSGSSGSSRTLTHSELLAEISAGTLHKGESITISDYRTVHTIPNTTDTNTGDLEPLLVTAMSNNELKPEAYSVLFPDDVIYYCPDNDQVRVAGCTKGYIYRRVDTKQNNDIPFDFRQVKFRRWQVSVSAEDTTGAIANYTKGNLVKKSTTNELYVKLNNTEAVEFTDTVSWRLFEWNNLDYISPIETTWYIVDDSFQLAVPCSALYNDYKMWAVSTDYDTAFSNTIDMPSGDLVVNSNTVIFGANFYSNSIGESFISNSIGSNFYYNSIGANFNSNSIGSYFFSNSIGSDFYNNSIGANFIYNSIGANFNNNSIGSNFNYNSIGSNFNNNSIEANFISNSIGSDFISNSIGSDFYNNSIGAYFYSNSIGGNFYSNSIGSDFNYNSIGAYFNYNSIGASFNYNSIGESFNYNSIGGNFNYNSIGESFNYNSIGAYFCTNSIGGNFFNNSIGGNFYSNSIGENFRSNSIGANFSSNQVANNFNNCAGTSTGVDFTLETNVNQTYSCELFTNAAGLPKLKYYDASDVAVIVTLTQI